MLTRFIRRRSFGTQLAALMAIAVTVVALALTAIIRSMMQAQTERDKGAALSAQAKVASSTPLRGMTPWTMQTRRSVGFKPHDAVLRQVRERPAVQKEGAIGNVALRAWLSSGIGASKPEHADKLGQPSCLLLQAIGRRCTFLDERGVLLCDLVKLRDCIPHLRDASRLLVGGRRDF